MLILRTIPRIILFSSLCFSGGIASADDSPTSDVSELDSIDDGIRLYLDGRLREAKLALQSASSSALTIEEESEALIYLAEIEYYLGERDASWLTCQRIVHLDQNYRPDPLVHPPEMLVFFETARLATVEHYENTVSSDYYDVPEPSTSLLVLIPGVSQYRRGNRRLGLVTGTAFAALSVASVSLWGAMRSYDTDDEKQGVQVFTNADLETAQRLLVLTELTRAGAAGVWVTSIVQELSIRPRVTLADEQLFTSVFVTGSW